mmetsp:Transcript_43168/g.137268  ORF Transcript_43168/g.137268 Transcript_43168/m.137268 type:complete len:365 (-) Transcript_43168:8-1102(-)
MYLRRHGGTIEDERQKEQGRKRQSTSEICLGAHDVHRAPLEEGGYVVGDDVHQPLPRLQALPADVGREDDVFQRVQGAVRYRRLLILNIEPCTSDRAGLQRCDQVILLDERAAARVDDEGRGLHQLQGCLLDDVPRLPVQGAVEADEVAGLEQLFQRHGVRLRAPARDEHLHAHELRDLCNLAADAAAATDEAKGLAPQLEVWHLQALGEVVSVALRQHAHLRHQGGAEVEQERDDQLSDRIAAVGRAVADRDALLLGGCEVDVVEAGASLLDQAHGRREARDDVARNRDLLGDDDLLALDTLQDLLRGGVALEPRDLRSGGQLGEVQAVVEVQSPCVHDDSLRHGAARTGGRVTQPAPLLHGA